MKRVVAAIAKATRQDATGRLYRARLRQKFLTEIPDQLLGGHLSRSYRALAVETREISITHPNWPRSFHGVRIGHITDLHAGTLITPEMAEQVVQSLRGLSIDLVACTGDVTDLHAEDSRRVLRALGALDAPLGKFLVLGNHDCLEDASKVVQIARQSGVHVLRNAWREVIRGGEALRIAGTEWANQLDACAKCVDLASHNDGHSAHLLLTHNPKSFRRASHLGVPLTLAGHTHGGQMALSKRVPALPKSAAWRRLLAGHYRHGESHLYVSSGVGGWFPLRVNRPPEVVILTVSRGNS